MNACSQLQHQVLVEKATFHKKNQLKNHMMNVHEEGWVICTEHCGRKFKAERFLEAHLERVTEQARIKKERFYSFQSINEAESISNLEKSLQSSIGSVKSDEQNEIDKNFLIGENQDLMISNQTPLVDDSLVPTTLNMLGPLQTTFKFDQPLEFGLPINFNCLPGDRRFTDDFELPKEAG